MPAAALFKLFGFDVTWKVLLRVGIGIAAAVVLYLAYNAVSNHFKHIADLETQNEQLKTKVTRVEGQRDQAIETNRQNLATAKTNDEIRANNQEIATAERAAANARTQTYKEIRNAIQDAPPAAPSRVEQPVAPVVTGTLDRLWGPATPGTRNPDRNP